VKLVACVASGVWAALASTSLARPVVLRDGTRVEGKVLATTLGGVRLEGDGAGNAKGARVVSWDLVKGVEGDAGAGNFGLAADALWRARTRLERGDARAAEAVAEPLVETYASEGGPSALLAAECVVRCRLARGAQAAAVSAWLWWVQVQEGRGTDVWIGGGTALGAMADSATGLAVQLAPMWAPGPTAVSAASSTDWSRARASGGSAGALAELYEKAARFEAGLDTEVVLTGAEAKGDGVAFVREIVLARGGDAEARAGARQALERRLAVYEALKVEGKAKDTPRPRWVEAWCRVALGRSMVREQDERVRMQGVLQLLHVPARFGRDQASLAALALAESAVALESMGDADGAAALRDELERAYPADPVRAWESLRSVGGGREKGAGGGGAAGSRNAKGPA
jgi:hypothetical protein